MHICIYMYARIVQIAIHTSQGSEGGAIQCLRELGEDSHQVRHPQRPLLSHRKPGPVPIQSGQHSARTRGDQSILIV